MKPFIKIVGYKTRFPFKEMDIAHHVVFAGLHATYKHIADVSVVNLHSPKQMAKFIDSTKNCLGRGFHIE